MGEESRHVIAASGGISLVTKIMQQGDDALEKKVAFMLALLSLNVEAALPLVDAGVIAALVTFASEGNDVVSQAAAMAVVKLTEDPLTQTAVVSSGVIPELLQLVWRDRSEKIVSVLDKLSKYPETHSSIVRGDNLTKLFALTSADSGSDKQLVAQILHRIAANSSHGGIPVLVEFVNSGSVAVMKLAAEVLVSLSSDAELHSMLIAEGGISAFTKMLEREDNTQSEACLEALVVLFESAANHSAFVAAGGMHALMPLVFGDSNLKTRVLMTLLNMSEDRSFHAVITAGNCISQLVELLGSSRESFVDMTCAATIIGNLAASLETHDAIIAAGGLQPIAMLADESTSVLKEKAASALLLLALNLDNHAAIVESGGIPPLLILADEGNEIQKEPAVEAIYTLSKYADAAEVITTNGGISILEKLVAESSSTQKQFATEALSNLSKYGSEATSPDDIDADNHNASSVEGELQQLFSFPRDGSSREKEAALQELWKYVLEGASTVDCLDLASITEPLVELIFDGTPTERENAAGVLGFLSSRLDADIKAIVAINGGSKALLSFIQSHEDDESVQKGLAALLSLCGDGDPAVCASIEGCGGKAVLSKVLENDNEVIKDLAAIVLRLVNGKGEKLCEACDFTGDGGPLSRHIAARQQALEERGIELKTELWKRLIALLETNRRKSMVERLVGTNSIANMFADLHFEFDAYEAAEYRGVWKSQWESERDAMKQRLFSLSMDQLELDHLDSVAQTEAITLLAHESKRNRASYTSAE